MTIGKRIADRRKVKKITQAALADSVGVTTAFISQIESGIRKPSYGLMLKISHELQVPLESILSDNMKDADDPSDKLIFSLIPFLDADKKKKLIDHIFLLTGSKYYQDIPFLTSPTEYAQFIVEKYKIKDVPVDISQVAEKLGVAIIKAEIGDCEGILYKNSENPLLVLNPESNHLEREKFTVAILLGHLVMPWHLKHAFYRLKDKRSLDHEDQFDMEARQFAGELMLPGLIVKRDFKKLTPSIENFEKFAYEKYKCSMTALAHKYSEYFGQKAVYITSDKTSFTRKYDTGFPYKVVDEVKPGSFAYSFVTDPPASKEIRKGKVESSVWFENVSPKKKVYEESMLDPKYGITVTLLQFADK